MKIRMEGTGVHLSTRSTNHGKKWRFLFIIYWMLPDQSVCVFLTLDAGRMKSKYLDMDIDDHIFGFLSFSVPASS